MTTKICVLLIYFYLFIFVVVVVYPFILCFVCSTLISVIIIVIIISLEGKAWGSCLTFLFHIDDRRLMTFILAQLSCIID